MEKRLNIVISGSRYSAERAIIIKALQDKGFDNLDIYDCESTVTDVQYTKWDPLSPENQIYDFTEKEIREVTAKQLQINETILNCDWFIFVAPTDFYGKWTYMEWKVMLNAIRAGGKKRVLSVIRCENCSDSVKAQAVSDAGEYSFSDFESLQKEILSIENYYVTYKYDSNFADLKNKFSEEIYKVRIQNLVMSLISKPRNELMPSDIFKNIYRTEPENGFDENFYLSRSTVDGALEEQSPKTFTMVLGAPASGKTRALYEYLKHSAKVSDDARIIILTRRNIEEVINHLENYKIWHSGLRRDDQANENLSDYYFVCDQIFDEIYNADDISLWWKLYDLAVYRFGACILATSLIEEYENNKSSLFVSDEIRYNEIRISNLSDETDSRFSDQFREHFSDVLQEEGEAPAEPAADLFDPFQPYDMNENAQGESVILRKQVIGDYIRGLVDYHESIMRMITDYDRSHNNIIRNFTKSFNIIKLYRHISNVPVVLVFAVFNKISSSPISQETYEEFKDFCLRNNILTIKNSGGFEREYIENGAIYDFDKEKVMIPLAPNFHIEIRNDYIWSTVREKHRFSLADPESMEDCMEYYCKAFFSETPVNTLKRIIARSPSVRFSIDLRGHENFVRQYVCREVNALCHNRYSIQYDKNEMNELIAYILHRSNSIQEFMRDYNTFTEWVGQDWSLSEEIVGELMGFGVGKTKSIRDQLQKFLKEKGWDFRTRRLDLYYHQRMIQYMESFEEITQYMNDVVLNDMVINGQTEDEDLLLINKRNFCTAIIEKALLYEDLFKMLDWIEMLQAPFDRKLFYKIKQILSTHEFEKNDQQNQKFLARLNAFFNSGSALNQIPPKMNGYYLITISSCFQNTLPYYRDSEELKVNMPLKNRAISEMIKKINGSEFSFLYRFFIKEKVWDDLALVSKNHILKSLNISDAINLVDLMFTGKDRNSVADGYTLAALLESNYEFFKTKRYFSTTNYAFQHLLHILSLPAFRNLSYEPVSITLMLKVCSSNEQENHLIDNYIKPALKKSILKKERLTDRNEINERVDRIWNDMEYIPVIANTRIHNPYKTDFEWIYNYAITAMDRMLATRMIQNPNILNLLMGKLYFCYTKGHLDREGAETYKTRLMRYLGGSLEGKRRFDFFYKDAFFYRVYFRLFPEKATTLNEEGKYVLSNNIQQIPESFIDIALLANIMDGVEAWELTDKSRILHDLNEIKKRNYTYRQEKKKFKKQSEKYFQSDKWDLLCELEKESHNKLVDAESLLSEIAALKEEDCDSLPSPSLMHKVLKNRNLSAKVNFGLLEMIYLKYGLVITSTMWKSSLEGLSRIRHSGDKIIQDTWDRLTALKYRYGDLILEDTCSTLYQILLMPDDAEKSKAFEVFIKDDHFRTLQEYGILIQSSELFTKAEDYIRIMDEHDYLNFLLNGYVSIDNTYAHFLCNITKKYSEGLSEMDKKFIATIMKDFDEYAEIETKKCLNKYLNANKIFHLYREMAKDVGYTPSNKK